MLIRSIKDLSLYAHSIKDLSLYAQSLYAQDQNPSIPVR